MIRVNKASRASVYVEDEQGTSRPVYASFDALEKLNYRAVGAQDGNPRLTAVAFERIDRCVLFQAMTKVISMKKLT